MFSSSILSRLYSIVGEAGVLVEPDDLKHFGMDKTTIWEADPSAIVLPRSVLEVQQIVKLANVCIFAIVPSGGRTGSIRGYRSGTLVPITPAHYR